MKEIIAPEQVAIVGTIVSIKILEAIAFENINNDVRVITIEPLDESPNKDLWLNESMIEGFDFDSEITIGNVINATVDVNVGGVTQYLDEQDIVHTHTQDGYGVRNIAGASAIAMARAGVPEFIIKDVISARKVKTGVTKPMFHISKKNVTDVTEQVAMLQKKLSALVAGSPIAKQIQARIVELEAMV